MRARTIRKVQLADRFSAARRLYAAHAVATDGAGQSRCAETGLAVPECSCKRCFERMLREFSPELLDGEIRITRVSERDGPSEQREAA